MVGTPLLSLMPPSIRLSAFWLSLTLALRLPPGSETTCFPPPLPCSGMKPRLRFAIDVGGVLIEKADRLTRLAASNGEDTVFDPSDVRYVEGALESVEALASMAPDLELWILSYCGERREMETLGAFRDIGLMRFIPVKRMLFCRKRSHKKLLMAEHGLDLLVDDRGDNCDDVEAAGFGVMWFRGDGGDSRAVGSWREVVERVERRIKGRPIGEVRGACSTQHEGWQARLFCF
jgi:hypothetical protein